MNLEEQASYLQSLKEEAKLDLQNPRQKLLLELTDTVSLLCHQISLLSEVSDGLNESLSMLQEEMDFLAGMDEEEDEPDGMGVDEYFDGSENPLYQVKCPDCGDQFAVDEKSLVKGFKCPTCGAHLVQAE